MAFYKILRTIEQTLLSAYQWCKSSLKYYLHQLDIFPDAHVRLSHCLDIIIKELNN